MIIRKKKIVMIVLAVILVVAVSAIIMFANLVLTMKAGEETLASIKFTDIDVSTIKDGIYTGEFKAGLVYAKVNTSINDGKITDIKLIEHKNGKGSSAESIISDIIEKQKTDVDAVSGATISSKVIRKAIENSLTKENMNKS